MIDTLKTHEQPQNAFYCFILFYISRWTLILKSFSKVRNSMFIIIESQRVQYSIYVIMNLSFLNALFVKCKNRSHANVNSFIESSIIVCNLILKT